MEKKIPDYNYLINYITIQEFNKLTLENFDARLKQALLAIKNDIADFILKSRF